MATMFKGVTGLRLSAGLCVVCVVVPCLVAAPCLAESSPTPSGSERRTDSLADADQSSAPVVVDRFAVRFTAPETGGLTYPRFISERLLAFSARLEALHDPGRPSPEVPYQPRHVRRALERHIAETLLASLQLEPVPTADELDTQALRARYSLVQEIGSASALREAAEAEGIATEEVNRMFRRQARARLYLERKVSGFLDPSDAELRFIHATEHTPFMNQEFSRVKDQLEDWHVGRVFSGTLRDYFEAARSRVQITNLFDRSSTARE